MSLFCSKPTNPYIIWLPPTLLSLALFQLQWLSCCSSNVPGPSDLAVAIGMEHSFLFPQLSAWLLMNWSSKKHWLQRAILEKLSKMIISLHPQSLSRFLTIFLFPFLTDDTVYLFRFYILWFRVVLCACSVFSICCGHEQTLEMPTVPPGALISLFLLRFLCCMYVSHSVYCWKGKIILLWLHYPSGHYNRVIDICWMSNLEREQFNYFTVE